MRADLVKKNDVSETDKLAALVAPVKDFLLCETPDAWLQQAVSNLDVLLVDHANCEKKAASTALNLIYKYIDFPELLNKLSRLAREELRHFEQVLAIMEQRNITYQHVSASRYAAGLRDGVSASEPHKLVDTLICGAIIEARSCERFAALAPLLDDELAAFYRSLLKSEARHFKDYLKLAKSFLHHTDAIDEGYLNKKTAEMLGREAELITSPDNEFRFHSGVVSNSGVVSDSGARAV